ncbi:MAG: carboxypeptidase regulatory-like domain-containing protein, partial [Chloracidobacterium sp.]
MKRLMIYLSLIMNCVLYLSAESLGQTTGTLRGVVTDPNGAVLAGAQVTLTLEGTQNTRVGASDEDGTFEFPALPIGTYRLTVEAYGFKRHEQANLEVSLGRVNAITVRLEVGETTEVVKVEASGTPMVETDSTQIGASVNSRAVVNLPLNTRDTYQFLQLQPGVQSQLGSDLFTGSDQVGVVSVNGGRGRSNNFNVNGGEANDLYVNLPAVQPSPDAIEEFRVLTNTFDAEYGRNSGSVVNVVTKSGTDQFRGNLFEFFRHRALNARNFFNLQKPDYNQHIFGGTLGGPIWRGRTYFFTSYEGRRIRQGIPSDVVPVPTAAERLGDFSAGPLFGGSIADATVATVLNARPGCAAAVAAAGGAPIAAGTAYADIFPGNRIPVPCFDRTAADLMRQFVPLPNLGDSFFQANPLARQRGDQVTLRLDHRLTDRQQLSAFVFYSDSFTREPFARVADSGANVPGFGNLNNVRIAQINLSHTWTSTTTINELRAVYFRQNLFRFNSPERSTVVNASCRDLPPELCFSDPSNPRLGIIVGVGAPHEGVPWIGLEGGFSIGNNYQGEIPQVVNTYQLTNNLTRIFGNHTAKFGVDLRQQRYLMTNFGALNGQFSFFGGGPNSVGYTNLLPNYLLGLVDSYYQTGAQTSHFYSQALYLFAQDSWKVTPSITLNYGLRWELNTPPADRFRRVQSFRAGLASTQFPCRLAADNPLVGVFGSQDCGPTGPGRAVFPLGLGIPGDEGVPDGLFPTYYKAFAPRIGLAWSPGWQQGWLSKLTGGPGNTSLRTGWGMFYNGPIEGLILAQLVPQPPFGISSNITNTFFSTPFLRQDGTVVPNPSDGILNPQRGTPVDYSVFRPILLYGQIPAQLRPQYSVQYNLTLQRKLQKDLLLQVGYVGTQGHRLLLTRDINFGNPQTCLDLNRILGPGTCGPFGADNAYVVPAGAIPPGVTLHLPYGPQRTVTGPNNPAITLVGLRPFSSPFCNPLTGEGCPP